MRYVSTRGQAPPLDFEEVTLAGLAGDGGLYVPERWPTLAREAIAALAGRSYVETAVAVMTPFVGEALSADDLRDLCTQAYGRFAHDAVTPLVQLDRQHWLLELFHGPTLAFKDVALQLLGLLFERFLAARDTHLTVIGATSGDTGSAAIDALAGRAKVDIFMLHPQGRVSEVQRRQMTTVRAPNVHNIALAGASFDDAQALVKRMFGHQGFAGRFALSAVNSINWARLMAQVVYYFYAAVRLGAPARPVAFAVPTGNFGDVFAGYVAAKMGLPVAKLIVATNVNDILHRALSAGDYSAGGVTPTAAPSMDIQVSSNFERLLFDLHGRDGAALARAMAGFEATRALALPPAMRAEAGSLFASARIDADAMFLAMREAWQRAGQLIDPHTAIGLAAARGAGLAADVPVVTLATAHPAKFPDAVERATGQRPPLPPRLDGLFERAEDYAVLPAALDAVEDFIAARAGGGMTARAHRLANGLTVAVEPMAGVETVALGVYADVGARSEPEGRAGLAHMVEHMVFKGAGARDARQIAERIEDVGGSLNAWTARDQTVFHARLMAADADLGLDILADLVTAPRFDPDELEREKSVVLAELGEARDTPDDIIFDHLQAITYPDHPLGRAVLGDEASIAAIAAEDLRGWTATQYRPENLVVAAAGKIDEDRLLARVEARFGHLAPGRAPPPAPARFAAGVHHDRRRFDQFHIALAWPGVGYLDDDAHALTLFAGAAGGGMSSRLFQEVREARGLAYSVYAWSSAHAEVGTLGLYLAAARADGAKALALAREIMAATAAMLSEEELARARTQAVAGLVMGAESVQARCDNLARGLQLHGRVVPLAEQVARFEAVTLAQARAAATAALAGGEALVTVGGRLAKAA